MTKTKTDFVKSFTMKSGFPPSTSSTISVDVQTANVKAPAAWPATNPETVSSTTRPEAR